jgi:hypothetical protein
VLGGPYASKIDRVHPVEDLGGSSAASLDGTSMPALLKAESSRSKVSAVAPTTGLLDWAVVVAGRLASQVPLRHHRSDELPMPLAIAGRGPRGCDN